MAQLSLRSPSEVLLEMGQRARALRLHRNVTQSQLSARADVSLRTLRRFERTGQASTAVMVRIAFALGAEEPIDALFPQPEARSIDEFLAAAEPGRQRARGSK
jgi:transcriptional regulator with XRE-family HTH domain